VIVPMHQELARGPSGQFFDCLALRYASSSTCGRVYPSSKLLFGTSTVTEWFLLSDSMSTLKQNKNRV
jgi:hypothetical protein